MKRAGIAVKELTQVEHSSDRIDWILNECMHGASMSPLRQPAYILALLSAHDKGVECRNVFAT